MRTLLTDTERVMVLREKRKAIEQEVREAEILITILQRHLERSAKLIKEFEELATTMRVK